jgi:Domain of unknown function (DUF4253)
MRSWEDRFGARVIGVGFADLYVSVAAPPATLDEALPVAAEHFAFCPDNIWQGHPHTLTGYASPLGRDQRMGILVGLARRDKTQSAGPGPECPLQTIYP